MDITHNNIYVNRILKIGDGEGTCVASINNSIETGLA